MKSAVGENCLVWKMSRVANQTLEIKISNYLANRINTMARDVSMQK